MFQVIEQAIMNPLIFFYMIVSHLTIDFIQINPLLLRQDQQWDEY